MTLVGGLVFAGGSQEGATSGEKPEIVIMTSDGRQAYAKQARNDDPFYLRLSELYGKADVRYEFLEHDRFNELLTLRFASADLTDVVQVNGIRAPQNPTAVDNHVFVPLNDLLDEYGPNIRATISDKIFASPLLSDPDGTIYGIPKQRALPATRVVMARKDWLERFGLDEPATPADYLEFFKLIKENDMDGDGDSTDEIPFGVRENLGYSELFFAYFGAFPGAWQIVDGKMVPDIVNPNMKDAIAFWRDLYANGYVNLDLFTRSGGDWVAQIRAGEIGVWTHDAQNLATTWALSGFNEDFADLAIMPGPQRPDGTTPLVPENPGFSRINVITRDAESPETTVDFFNWLMGDDPAKDRLFAFGIEGVHHTFAGGTVNWDPTASINTDLLTLGFYQTMLGPHIDNRMNPILVAMNPMADYMNEGRELAAQNVFPNPGMHMPLQEAQKLRPELSDRAGSLFLDMFAKVVTGKAQLDQAWDDYVAEWYRRGGDDLIEQATAWHNAFVD
jgi:ABC-type glycerol-3-phosphate transport system substrate-binding protein